MSKDSLLKYNNLRYIGQSRPCPLKTHFHTKSSTVNRNGFSFIKSDPPIETNACNLDPVDTYNGQIKKPYIHPFVPNHVKFDKMALRFHAYWKETIPECETDFRIRPVKIAFYMADNTIEVFEPPVKNSGLMSGKLIRRQKLYKDRSRTELLTFDQFNVDIDLSIYGKNFHIVSCDPWTREYLTSSGVEVKPDIPMPKQKREISWAKREAVNKSTHDKLRQFIENDKKVLRFYANSADTVPIDSGVIERYEIRYFLMDDTIEVSEKRSDCNTMHPIIKRMKIPKTDYQPTLSFNEQESYFTVNDLKVGHTVKIYSKRFHINCVDECTKIYLRTMFNIDAISKPEWDEQRKPQNEQPPTVTRKKLTHLNFFQPHLYGTQALRFLAIQRNGFCAKSKERYIISYHLATNFISISRPLEGKKSLKILKPQLIRMPDTDDKNPECYGPQEMYIGAVLRVYGREYEVIDADDFVLTFLEENHFRFPNIERTIESLRALKKEKESQNIEKEDFNREITEEDEEKIREIARNLRYANRVRLYSLTYQHALIRFKRTLPTYITEKEFVKFFTGIYNFFDESFYKRLFHLINKDSKEMITTEEFIDFFEKYERLF